MTSVRVVGTPNAGKNMLFICFLHEKFKKGTKNKKMSQNDAKKYVRGLIPTAGQGVYIFYLDSKSNFKL